MTTTTWNTNVGDGDYTNAANWTGGVPDATTDAVITGAGAISLPNDTGLPAKSLDLSGYTGQITIAGSAGFTVHGNVAFSSGMTYANPSDITKIISLRYAASGSLTSAGQTVSFLHMPTDGTTITLLDDARTCTIDLFGVGAVLALGVHTITVLAENISPGTIFVSDADITYSGAGKVVCACGAYGLALDVETATSLPPLTITGSGDVDLSGFPITAASVSIQSANLLGGSWTVAGSATASGATITDCDFSGGTALTATGCVDGGGNTNVNFIAAPPAAAPLRLGVSVGLGL